MSTEYGPFASERAAMDTRAAAALRAACDANPGTWKEQHLKVMTDACEAAGVELGAFDLRPFRQLAMYEPFNAVVIAAVIRRAFEAGKAPAPEGGVTEWSIAYTTWPGKGVPSRREIQPYPDEAMAREAVTEIRRAMPQDEPALMCRQAGPWKEVPDA